MASLANPGSQGVKELLRKLKCAREYLRHKTVRTPLDAFLGPENEEFEELNLSYMSNMLEILVLVKIVLRVLADSNRFSQLDGEVKGLSLLLLSLAEIEGCMESGRGRMLEFSKFSDSDRGNGSSSSRMKFFLLREFFFRMDLARAAFVITMLESKIHLEMSWESRGQSLSDIEEEFGNRPAHELLEWSERKCRPVLKQRALNLGLKITEHIALNDPDALTCLVVHEPELFCTADPDRESEEPSPEPVNLLSLEIDFEDVQDQVFLGNGSSGAVLQCCWHGKLAAVKIIDLDLEELAFERRFEREVSIMASLQHPNAVPVFGFGYTEGRAKGFFVMEHMQTDLENVIKERRELSGEWRVFPLDVAMDIMSQIVEGMCALRRRRVIHRDLKPANILVNRAYASMEPDESVRALEGIYLVKLADFGSASMRDGLDSVFRTVREGTVAYMAPEVMSPTLLPDRGDEEGYSWKADVYSFGLVCAEILSGERPFRHLNGPNNTFAAVRGGERPVLRLDSGDPLRRLIEDCWKFNSEERPDFGEVRRRLWECRVFHLFMAEEVSTSWQTYCTLLDARWW